MTFSVASVVIHLKFFKKKKSQKNKKRTLLIHTLEKPSVALALAPAPCCEVPPPLGLMYLPEKREPLLSTCSKKRFGLVSYCPGLGYVSMLVKSVCSILLATSGHAYAEGWTLGQPQQSHTVRVGLG